MEQELSDGLSHWPVFVRKQPLLSSTSDNPNGKNGMMDIEEQEIETYDLDSIPPIDSAADDLAKNLRQVRHNAALRQQLTVVSLEVLNRLHRKLREVGMG